MRVRTYSRPITRSYRTDHTSDSRGAFDAKMGDKAPTRAPEPARPATPQTWFKHQITSGPLRASGFWPKGAGSRPATATKSHKRPTSLPQSVPTSPTHTCPAHSLEHFRVR